MYRTRALALLAAVATISGGAVSSAQAASWLSVGPTDLCGSAGCFGSSKTFTKTFSAANRSGVVDIASLSVFRDIMGSSTNAVKVSFVMADGTEVSWGKFTLAALGGDVVTLAGQKVAWNTSLGDLTVKLDLIVPDKGGMGGGGGGGLGGSLGSFGGGGGGGLAFEAGGGGYPYDIVKGGPLVRPALPPVPVIAVPEPGAWALMILGFGAAGTMLRRRKGYHFKFG
jgi:hypothetical protein